MASADPKFPAGVKIHHDVYPAVDPTSTFSAQRYAGKVVLVTGASSGIGALTAQFYARAGASVALVARRADKLDEVISGVPEAKEKMLAIEADVKDTSAAVDAVKKTVEKFGKLDVLIANAGVITPLDKSLADKDPASVWNTFEINLKGTYNYVYAALPELQKTRGSIVAVSAGLAYMRVPGNSDYAISKLATNALVEWVHVEYPIIFAYAVHPGVVETDMAKSLDKPDSLKDTMIFDTPELAASAMLFLTLNNPAWLNGRYYSVNWDIADVEKLWKDKIVAGNALVTQLALP